MIKINLLKTGVRRTHRKPKKKNGGGFKKILVFFVVLLIIAGAGFGGYTAWRYVLNHPAPKPVVVQAETTFKPSSYVKKDIVEDIVSDQQTSDLALSDKTGILKLSYSELAFAEQVNYELLYARQICGLVSKITPPGVGIKSMAAEGFVSAKIEGYAKSREFIGTMISHLKDDSAVTLDSKASLVRPDKNEGFYFVIAFGTEFGLNLTDPLVDLQLGLLPNTADLKFVLDTIGIVARSNNVQLTGEMEQIGTEKKPSCLRSTYRMRAVTSYADFVSFVMALYNAKTPCAFVRFSLQAQSTREVILDADIVITTRD